MASRAACAMTSRRILHAGCRAAFRNGAGRIHSTGAGWRPGTVCHRQGAPAGGVMAAAHFSTLQHETRAATAAVPECFTTHHSAAMKHCGTAAAPRVPTPAGDSGGDSGRTKSTLYCRGLGRGLYPGTSPMTHLEFDLWMGDVVCAPVARSRRRRLCADKRAWGTWMTAAAAVSRARTALLGWPGHWCRRDVCCRNALVVCCCCARLGWSDRAVQGRVQVEWARARAPRGMGCWSGAVTVPSLVCG